jgi:hypothetical protein
MMAEQYILPGCKGRKKQSALSGSEGINRGGITAKAFHWKSQLVKKVAA